MTKIIIRDFDGPIIDSKRQCYDFISEITGILGDEVGKTMFDGNFFDKFRMLMSRDIQKEEVISIQNYYKDSLNGMHMIPGIDQYIELFDTKGYKQYIVTSNLCDISTILKKFGIDKFFIDILDGNVERSKIKKFHMVHEKEGGAISDYFFITDTVGDIKEAIEAGISPDHILAVTWGYHDRERLAQMTGIRLVDKVESLKKI